MSTQMAPYEEWYIPTIDEVETVREEQEITVKEMSELLGYEHRSGYGSTIYRSNVSVEKLQIAVDHFRENGYVDWYAPTIEEISQELDHRGIAQTHFSMSLGYSNENSFSVCVGKGQISFEKYQMVTDILDFHEEKGYLPMEWELEGV